MKRFAIGLLVSLILPPLILAAVILSALAKVVTALTALTTKLAKRR